MEWKKEYRINFELEKKFLSVDKFYGEQFHTTVGKEW